MAISSSSGISTSRINRGDIFIIMGGSGCGKSTLLRHLVGLKSPAKGRILYEDVDFWQSDEKQRRALMQRIGVLYQSGALWSSMTLAENIALPLGGVYGSLRAGDRRDRFAQTRAGRIGRF